ncbi:hypothetical protein LOY37_13970 [Pseudomonas sp. B21-012]|uniref:hypothetical protein n=1 Tax=Pseudomonas sp. B21-012 TaxID=2895472 RepID=UPI00215E14FB|nr:hypothetical protein [Pseudomonas sp. B21-012]UVM53485.1 hypothetical protein LOY37_13970 [Pseudomonas sp. B21-012]
MQTLDQRVADLERVLVSTTSALLNSILSIATALNDQPGFDKNALLRELDLVKAVQIEGGSQQHYEDTISMVQERLS